MYRWKCRSINIFRTKEVIVKKIKSEDINEKMTEFRKMIKLSGISEKKTAVQKTIKSGGMRLNQC